MYWVRCDCLKCTALCVLLTLVAVEHARIQNIRDFLQTMLNSEINAPYLLNKHGDPHFLFYKVNENNILNKWEKNWQKSVATFLANKVNATYLLRTEITKRHLNNRICRHCGVKTSTVTPSFCYVFNISLLCNNNIPSFIGNLWWVFLLGNHLRSFPSIALRIPILRIILRVINARPLETGGFFFTAGPRQGG